MNPYADDIEGAREAIEEDGELCTWFKPAPVDPDAKPWRDQRVGEPVEYPVSIAFFSPLDLARGRGQTETFFAGTDVASYTEVGLMAGGDDFEPALSDWLVRSSGKAQIVALDKVAPNGVAILWFVGIK